MVDEQGFQEEPLDFTHRSHTCNCPYCGETVNTKELENYLAPETNTFICPNCRKKLNIYELGNGILKNYRKVVK